MAESEAVELYRRHRPTSLSEVIGQTEAIAQLRGFIKTKTIPHFLLLTGPSGTGKTTIARILKKIMKCSDMDFREINSADERGIDAVRQIESQMSLAPMSGPCKIWLIDEVQQATGANQSMFLKLLEDTPSWVYFVFCTTDPQKLKSTIKTRATTINLKPVGRADLRGLIHKVYGIESGVSLHEEVSDKIIELADGSPRKALVLLGQILNIDDDEQKLATLVGTDASHEAIELCRLFLNPRAKWSDVTKILKGVQGLDEQVESIRWMILGYMANVALGGKNVERATAVINLFQKPFYDSKRAGLVLACYDAVCPE